LRTIFLDTQFVVALVNERDEHHQEAVRLVPLFRDSHIVTTGGVVLEIGNSLARSFRSEAVELIDVLLNRATCFVERVNEANLSEAIELFERHHDKTWGLVDCLSFVVMRRRRIREALTNDQHFEQAGFTALMRGEADEG
jgi:predicted nucleic acid-binding protein